MATPSPVATSGLVRVQEHAAQSAGRQQHRARPNRKLALRFGVPHHRTADAVLQQQFRRRRDSCER